MAIDRTTENQINASINRTRSQAVRRVNQVGIPLVLLASAVCPVGIPIWGLMWLIARSTAKLSGSPIMLGGAAGEDRVLAVLSRLPDDYTLFNQIRLPDEHLRTGSREADFVVVGPNGVFIIENKEFRGLIVGDEISRNWELHKIGRRGSRYVTSGRNPIRQVQIYVSLLAGIFRLYEVKAWITPLVSLSRDNSLDWIKSIKVRVVQATDLCDVILTHPGKLPEVNRVKVLEVLEVLRAGQLKFAIEINQHAA